jgi:hypothetical protein
MRTDGQARWSRERLLYLTVGVIICVVGVVLILT